MGKKMFLNKQEGVNCKTVFKGIGLLTVFLLLYLIVIIWCPGAVVNADTYDSDSRIAVRGNDQTGKVNGLIYLINVHAEQPIDGLLKWEWELKKLGIKAMIKASREVCKKYPELFKRLDSEGHELILSNPNSCWGASYEEQYQYMKGEKDFLESFTEKKVRVLACKYSSYDENTVRAAQSLGVEYILARGTEDVRALIYKPEEYDVRLIEVSNVAFGEMGRGSLCDISLFSRGSTPEEFSQIFKDSIEKNPDSIILVSHPHIGGVKKAYWQIYADCLKSLKVDWCSFNDWIERVVETSMPYNEIPVNHEVKYIKPKPIVPLEELEDLPQVGKQILLFHNDRGSMCKEAKKFLSAINYPIEEHCDTEEHFYHLLIEKEMAFSSSE